MSSSNYFPIKPRGVVALCLAMLLTVAGPVKSEEAMALTNGTIGYVFTDLFWSIYQTPGAEECPDGFNDGPREQFTALFPHHESLTVEQTQLWQEVQTWHPNTEPDDFAFHSVEGDLSWGLNLDGKVSDEDFTHPEGTAGIDNQIYRAVGCIIGFRGPDGVEYIFQDKAIFDSIYNRLMIEITGIDDLENDTRVTVNLYRGSDRLLTDATGSTAVAGGTQRIDRRWGQSLVRQMQGRIVDSVLTTEPIEDLIIPWQNLGVPSIQLIRDARFQLDLSTTSAHGLLAGFADVDTWYYQLIRNDSTHHLSNGQISGISLYKALRLFADAYPDPESGDNTAISTALDVKMTQVFIVEPE